MHSKHRWKWCQKKPCTTWTVFVCNRCREYAHIPSALTIIAMYTMDWQASKQCISPIHLKPKNSVWMSVSVCNVHKWMIAWKILSFKSLADFNHEVMLTNFMNELTLFFYTYIYIEPSAKIFEIFTQKSKLEWIVHM